MQWGCLLFGGCVSLSGNAVLYHQIILNSTIMKLLIKKIVLLITLAPMCLMAFSQPGSENWPGKNKVFAGRWIDTTHATPLQMTRVHRRQKAELLLKDHYLYDFNPLKHIGIRFKKTPNTASVIYQGLNWGPDNQLNSILIEGDCDIEVAALDITPKNVNEYRYRIIKNNSKEILPLTKPVIFKYTADGKAQYSYLGDFSSDGTDYKELKIELYKNSKLVDAVIVGWNIVKPAVVWSGIQFTMKSFPLPDNGLLTRGLNELQRTTEVVGKVVNNKWVAKKRPLLVKDFIETTSPNDIRFRADDSVHVLHFDIDRNKNSRLYKYKLILRRYVNGERDSIILGEPNNEFDLYKEFWKQPGKYTLAFIPKIYKHGGRPVRLVYSKVTEVSFTVMPPLGSNHFISLKMFVFVILVILSIALRIYFYLRRKNKLAAQAKEIATLQLQSVRSQLNPHFIFNALAGVQNLMNKNEVENANKYLARFARLTRNVLDDGQKELTSIEHEVSLLTDYLEMEQMRFGFKFTIDVDAAVDQQIEIPAMLLQPFAENAVKHGISALKAEGLITVNINQTEKDIVLKVSDNGSGFTNNPTPGMGIKLCEERIKLLNSIYKNSTILLHINPAQTGTIITIELKNWL